MGDVRREIECIARVWRNNIIVIRHLGAPVLSWHLRIRHPSESWDLRVWQVPRTTRDTPAFARVTDLGLE